MLTWNVTLKKAKASGTQSRQTQHLGVQPDVRVVFLRRAYYRLTDIVQQLTPYVEDVVRSEVPLRTLVRFSSMMSGVYERGVSTELFVTLNGILWAHCRTRPTHRRRRSPPQYAPRSSTR